MSCPHETTCPLFLLFRSHVFLRVWKGYYCDAAYTECERFKRSSAGQPVPANLLPNGTELKIPGSPPAAPTADSKKERP